MKSKAKKFLFKPYFLTSWFRLVRVGFNKTANKSENYGLTTCGLTCSFFTFVRSFASNVAKVSAL